jgi:hypothetical protein
MLLAQLCIFKLKFIILYFLQFFQQIGHLLRLKLKRDNLKLFELSFLL